MAKRIIAVIGGGASGLAAALTAAQDPANRVILFERQQRVGRKLLATGNGRCNLTNTGAELSHYHSEEPALMRAVLSRRPVEEELEFFHTLGLVTTEEYGGRVYPYSDSANSVLDVLRLAADAAGVEIRCSARVTELRRKSRGFVVITETEAQPADAVILACGGAAGGKLGGVSDGYELAKALGHSRTKLTPALVPLTTDPEYPRALKGVRADAGLRLLRGNALLAESRGELQFTETGISGPAAFDISRAGAREGGELRVEIDLLRNLTEQQILALLQARAERCPALEAAELFTGVLHNRLGRMIVKYSGLAANAAAGGLQPQELSAAARAAKHFVLKLKGSGDFNAAQVTAGGLRTQEFDPRTLQSRLCPGLYACGELLDVDGDCGGFNLHWAWASGREAGRLLK